MVWALLLLSFQDPAWDEIRIQATLRKDGALLVHQTLHWAGGRGKVVFGIDRANIDSIADIRLKGAELISTLTPDDYHLEWHANGPARFILSYTVWGAVYDGRLDWRAVSGRQIAPAHQVRIRIRLPKPVPESELALHSESGSRQSELFATGDTIEFIGTGLRPGRHIRIRAAVPEGVVDLPVMFNRGLTRHYGAMFLFAIPATMFLILLGLYVLWGQDPYVVGHQKDMKELPPAMAGLVIDEVAGVPEASATVADLLDRGILRVGEDKLVLEKKIEMADFEDTVVESLFGSGATAGAALPVSETRPDGDKLSEAIYTEGVRRGYFRRSPAADRRMVRIIGTFILLVGMLIALSTIPDQSYFLPALLTLGLPVAAMALSFQFERSRLTLALLMGGALALIIGLILLSPSITRPAFTWQCKLSVGISISGLIMIGFSALLPVKTTAGAEARALAASAMRSLEDRNADEFQQWLAHAVAFRMHEAYIRRMAKSGAKTPSWWSVPDVPLKDHEAALRKFLDDLDSRFRETINPLRTG